MRLRFEAAGEEGVEVCLAPKCDALLYAGVPERSTYTANNDLSWTNNDNSNSISQQSNLQPNYSSSTFIPKNPSNTSKEKYVNRNYSATTTTKPQTKWSNNNVTCYTCGQPGHISPNCPQKLGRTPPHNKNDVGGYKRQKSYETRHGGDPTDTNESKRDKMCKDCGVWGRHPRGSDCPAVHRKKKAPSD
jgi:hypothetical protein